MYQDETFDINPSLEDHEHVDDSPAEADEELTAASNSSHQSDIEPSFFIIPPHDSSDKDFRESFKHFPWDRIPGKGSKGRLTASGVEMMSVASSAMYGRLGAYRRDRLIKEIDSAGGRGTDGHAAILKTLKKAGVMIFIVDSKMSSSVTAIMESVQNVILHTRKVQKESEHEQQREKQLGGTGVTRAVCDSFCKNQWCLLYRDPDGRLFNLTLAPHTTAQAGRWEELMQSFSVLQAVSLLAVLCRSFSCATSSDVTMDNFGPAYLALILGLVFSEELSMSWTNVGMTIRGFPSISAYEIMTKVESDWLRKAQIFSLSIASAGTGTFRTICTLFGLSLTCFILLANLGARSWRFMGWKPAFVGESWCACFGCCCGLQQAVEAVLSYAVAVGTGFFLPYLGHQKVHAGGVVAIESVFRIATVVAATFLVSDRDEVQNFLVLGSGECSQDYVNMAFGGWFCMSLISCLCCLSKRKPAEFWPDSKEPLLAEDHASPVGLRVPHLPDFPIDPTFAAEGNRSCVNMNLDLVVGVFIALGIGAFFVYLGFSDLDEQILNS
jgi:hypothetical protein